MKAPVDWLRLQVEGIPRDRHHLLAEALRRLGGRGLERNGDEVSAYLPSVPRRTGWEEGLRESVRRQIRAATSVPDPRIRIEAVATESLEGRWRAGQRLGAVGPRLELAAPGDEPGPYTILLPPGPAFGDGSHPSTRLALRLLDLHHPGRGRLLDLGTGSGILTVAALRLGAEHVTALEADGPSIDHARETFRRNEVLGAVALRQVRAGPAEIAGLPAMDGILANVEAPVLAPLLPALVARLRPGGWLLCAGLGREDEPLLRARLQGTGAQVQETLREGGWTAWWIGRSPMGEARGDMGDAVSVT